MALDRFNDDLNFVGNLGDDPKRDDGLSTPQFKSYFDKAGLAIQRFINNKLIPQIESAIDEGALLQQITSVINRKLDKAGGVMTGNIDMNWQKITNLPTPVNDGDAATKEYADSLTSFHTKVTLTAVGWTGDKVPYTQTVVVDGITKDDEPHYGPVYDADYDTRQKQKEAFNEVSDLETAYGSVTFTCDDDKPGVDLVIQMEVNR